MVFILKITILGCFGGSTILGNTHTGGSFKTFCLKIWRNDPSCLLCFHLLWLRPPPISWGFFRHPFALGGWIILRPKKGWLISSSLSNCPLPWKSNNLFISGKKRVALVFGGKSTSFGSVCSVYDEIFTFGVLHWMFGRMMYHFVIKFSEHTFQHAFLGRHLSTNGEVNGADCCFHFTQIEHVVFCRGAAPSSFSFTPCFFWGTLCRYVCLVVSALCTYIYPQNCPNVGKQAIHGGSWFCFEKTYFGQILYTKAENSEKKQTNHWKKMAQITWLTPESQNFVFLFHPLVGIIKHQKKKGGDTKQNRWKHWKYPPEN